MRLEDYCSIGSEGVEVEAALVFAGETAEGIGDAFAVGASYAVVTIVDEAVAAGVAL
jgi:hypothetical protein